MISSFNHLVLRWNLGGRICKQVIGKRIYLASAQNVVRKYSSNIPTPPPPPQDSLELDTRTESFDEPSSYNKVPVICHKCKQPGHFARECPSVGTLCFRCGQTGHLSYNCQNAKSCYRCGSNSHLASDCPSNVCYKCMKPGHFAKDCPAEKVCYRCGQAGHVARDCSVVNSQHVKAN